MMGEYAFTSTGMTGNQNQSLLEQFSTNLSEIAKNGLLDPVKCRDEEINKVLKILSRRKKNNALLLGDPGVGKSAIVEGLAQKIEDKECSPFLHDKEVRILDMTLITAGTKFRGEFEERLTKIMDEVRDNPSLIIFIDEIHTIVGAGSAAGSMDAANIIKPALARGEFQCIGATTNEEYKKHFRTDKALDRRFQSVKVEEPSAEDTLIILQGLKEDYELFHKVKYTQAALERAVDLSGKYINQRFFPDKAIDLIDEAGASKKVDVQVPTSLAEFESKIEEAKEQKMKAAEAEDFVTAAKFRDKQKLLKEQYQSQLDGWFEKLNNKVYKIEEKDIEEIIAAQTGIPVSKLNQSDRDRLIKLEEFLGSIVIGQDDAIVKISKSIRRNRFGLRDESKPIGSFLFTGPTGVGKTFLAKNIAKHIFGSEKKLIRIDMSEFQDRIDSGKLAGAAPGYVGYEEGGNLTEKVRNNPYSVLLLDEIEKAHPDVFNTFLQVLDDGILTDNKGETVSFKNTIIIMTSNLGISKLQDYAKPLGFTDDGDDQGEALKTEIINGELKKFFRPEFLNRLDDTVIFNYLSEENILEITNNALKDLVERVSTKGFKLTIKPKAKKLIANKGYDKLFGARPLNRAIANLVESPITDEILKNGYESGEITIKTKTKKGEEELDFMFDCN